MIKSNLPVSILEFGSTHIRLGIYDKLVSSQNLFYEKKINYTRDNNFFEDHPIVNIIRKAEKDTGNHLNEITLLVDTPSILSLDLSIQKSYEDKIINNLDINYLINECENIVNLNNSEKEIIHVLKSNIYFDGKIINDLENISQKASKVTLDIKFILVDKKISNFLKNLFIKNDISLDNIFCTTFIKSLGLIKKLDISGPTAFIDIGLKKSCLSIFQDEKLLYINNTHIGGDHVTKDITKILKIDYRTAEAQKLKFSKKDHKKKNNENNELLKKIINSRLEEIIEILFFDCPLIRNNYFNSGLKLYFVGNGSKVLNENLLSFGSEFNFIKEMSIIDEVSNECCNSALNFRSSLKKIQPYKAKISFENKGFFEKLFDYFTKK